MQGNTIYILGWRKNMEDASIHCLDIGDCNSVFAVFDGHGGKY
jgi:serine/threonine protein phosphatase PrpC